MLEGSGARVTRSLCAPNTSRVIRVMRCITVTVIRAIMHLTQAGFSVIRCIRAMTAILSIKGIRGGLSELWLLELLWV